jgi:hypothetical protein
MNNILVPLEKKYIIIITFFHPLWGIHQKFLLCGRFNFTKSCALEFLSTNEIE